MIILLKSRIIRLKTGRQADSIYGFNFKITFYTREFENSIQLYNLIYA